MKDNFRFKALAVACVVTMLAAGSRLFVIRRPGASATRSAAICSAAGGPDGAGRCGGVGQRCRPHRFHTDGACVFDPGNQ